MLSVFLWRCWTVYIFSMQQLVHELYEFKFAMCMRQSGYSLFKWDECQYLRQSILVGQALRVLSS